jgi:hypothetical protein
LVIGFVVVSLLPAVSTFLLVWRAQRARQAAD